MNASIRQIQAILLAGFAMVSGAMGYWQVFRGDDLARHPSNPRAVEAYQRSPRGRILDRAGVALAWSQAVDGRYSRRYSDASVVGVTGYTSSRYGTTGVESRFDSYLTGNAGRDLMSSILRVGGYTPMTGADVVTTIDARIQRIATESMRDAAGAAVVMDPKTGEVLAMVSLPTFDPSAVDDDWPRLVSSPASPLLNRAIQSTFAPGSIFKIVTAAAAIDRHLVDLDTRFSCTRPMNVDGLDIDCRNHSQLPSVNFREAFAWSSNRTFALTALELGTPQLVLSDDLRPNAEWARSHILDAAPVLEDYARRFGFDADLPFDLPVSWARLKSDPEWRPSLLAQTGFGQGQLRASPLLMAVVASTIANDGVRATPRLTVGTGPDGDVFAPLGFERPAARVIESATARILTQMMVLSVDTAYAQKARIPNLAVAGKTGTAESGPTGSTPHAWFVGFAPADNPRVAIAVVVEHGGSGADVAAPIAQRIMRVALDLYQPKGR